MALLAHDAADRVQQLTALTERLTGRLAEESAAFEARRPQDATASLEETARLANLYRHESARIKADPGLIAAAPAAQRARLAEATRAFEAALSRHARALEAAKTITEGIVQAVAREVAAARASGAGYGASGRTVAGDAAAVALNRRA